MTGSLMTETLLMIGIFWAGFLLILLHRRVHKRFLDESPLHQYQPEHIADFVAFAKTQLDLPKVKAIKAIRLQFAHLTLQQALQVYELANKEHNHSQ